LGKIIEEEMMDENGGNQDLAAFSLSL